MKILITGSDGFIASNLTTELKNRGYTDLFLFNHNTSEDELKYFLSLCDTVIHLAGVNRPKADDEFRKGNVEFTQKLLNYLENRKTIPHIIFASSIQAQLDNPYGRSKLEAERILQQYANEKKSPLTIYRFPNVFGKWCKPNYNSVVATFCFNIAQNIEIQVHDANKMISLVYIDDAVDSIIKSIEKPGELCRPEVEPVYRVNIGTLAETICSFKSLNDELRIPNIENDFTKKLYSTYLSYIAKDGLKYSLSMNKDNRGSFTEFLRKDGLGQISINITKPGIIKGNHWHHTKVEKFLVVSGRAVIRLRNKITGKLIEFLVSGELLEVIDIPAGYVHSIANIGNEDLVTVMWANETFDKENPDTYYEKV